MAWAARAVWWKIIIENVSSNGIMSHYSPLFPFASLQPATALALSCAFVTHPMFVAIAVVFSIIAW